MKILKLTFENINSLKGKWQIDFEDLAFSNHALFAITGPTGAGKTTILDAICLALYGETPRLNISANQNELMSIGTAFASSTLIFRANQKIYKASWAQRRANQKSDGKLQAIHREISLLQHADDDNGQILEEKASLVTKQIEQILGMNKAQFTRSVMLVQGEFAAFLQSDAAERGQILEQITGTHIYAKISQAAFEKNKKQNHLLKELQIKLGEVQLLDSESYQTLIEQLQDSNQQKQQLETNIQHADNQLKLANQYTQLYEENSYWQEKLKQNQTDFDNFLPNQKRLNDAKQAQSLQSFYQALTDSQNSHQAKNRELSELIALLPTQQNQLDEQIIIQKNYQEKLQKINLDYDNAKSVLHAVRQLDQQIITAKQTQTHQQQNLDKTRNEQIASEQVLSDAQAQKHALQQEMVQIEQQLNQNHYDKLLEKLHICDRHASQFDGVVNPIVHAYDQQLINLNKLHEKIGQLDKMRADYKAERQNLQQPQDNIVHHKKNIINVLKLNNQADLYSLSDFENIINEQQTAIKKHSELQHTLTQISQAYQQYLPMLAEMDSLHDAQAKLAQEEKTSKDTLELLTKNLQKTQEIQSSMAENFELHQQILHMKQHFDKLNAGDACPLCGSTTHPYKALSHHLDGSDAQLAKQKLDDCQQELAVLNLEIENQNKALYSTQIYLQNNQEKLDNLSKQSHTIYEQLEQLWLSIAMHFGEYDNLPDADTIAILVQKTTAKISTLEQTYAQASQLINQLNQAIHSEKILQSKVDNLLALGQQRRQDAQELYTHIKTQNAHLADALIPQVCKLLKAQNELEPHQDLSDFDVHLQTIGQSLGNLLSHIKGDMSFEHERLLPIELNLTKLASVRQNILHTQQNLTQKVDKLQQLSDVLGQKQTAAIRLDAQIAEKTHTLQTLLPAIDEWQAAINASCHDIQQLNGQRHELFGTKNPDDIEQNYQSQLKNIQADLDGVNLTIQNSFAALQAHKANIQSLTTLVDELTIKQQNNQADFDAALAASPFASQAQFLAAILPTDEIANLQAEFDKINHQLNQATISLANNQEKLDALVNQNPNVSSLQVIELQENLSKLQAQWADINQKIGELTTLKNNEENRRTYQADLIEQIEKQQQQNAIWAKLDALIGSADGKKYRNFVQGLTLDLVLHHANQILAKMNDRYLLTFDGDSGKSLEILVTDLHQGDAVRSSKNLSGGESFIISLALALGLSQINSQNVQIESLFLDEGFGTLDETALDLALGTLFELQQSGKSIGIISHVASLKERIDTQIVVEKQAGGNSTLIGAGVRRLHH
ncbi:AAA family ATPase [Moraxella sp. ZJ142]|uniref:AAA family ATPase n=1 Tax=Moraxella marmotae TaxID=3344520 RepID=UPI0035D40AE1